MRASSAYPSNKDYPGETIAEKCLSHRFFSAQKILPLEVEVNCCCLPISVFFSLLLGPLEFLSGI